MKKFLHFLLNYKKVSYLNFKMNFMVTGNRNSFSFVFCNKKLSAFIHKSARINITNGFFLINDGMRVKEPFRGMLEMNENSEINVKNSFSIYSGANIIILKGASLNLGSGYINRNVKIRCYKEISIGENVAISEDVTFWDSDAHTIRGKEEYSTQPITIGNHVWIGTKAIILKGVSLGNGCVVAAGSVVTKSFPAISLIAGNPARLIRENVNWQ